MPRVRFKPLRISKRRSRQPWFSEDKKDHDYSKIYDVEKHNGEWEDESYDSLHSENSSRASSGSYQSHEPMLSRSRRKPQEAKAYAPRKKCNIYFTVILGTTLVVFVLTLVQLHNFSAAEVSSGVHKPELKPPAWEDFPKLQRYFGGLRALVTAEQNKPEYPGNEEDLVSEVIEALQNGTVEERSDKKRSPQDVWSDDLLLEVRFQPEKNDRRPVPCSLDAEKPIRVPSLYAYEGVVKGFPESVIGSSHSLDGKSTSCFDRFGRLGPYGFGYSQAYGGSGTGLNGDLEGAEKIWARQPEIDYRNARWSEAQESCLSLNAHRYESNMSGKTAKEVMESNYDSRTAILVRKTSGQEFTLEETLNLRALISEASLATGGAFTVHFLIQFPDDENDLWTNKDLYAKALDESLSEEFRGMGYAWTEQKMRSIYEKLAQTAGNDQGIFGADRGAWLPVQQFAQEHPEYDFFWNWDLNTRSTSHIGQVLTQLETWARSQPRKELWERNTRFFVPSEHGKWDDFVHMVHILAEHKSSQDPQIFEGQSASSSTRFRSIWGPVDSDEGVLDPSLTIHPSTPLASDAYRTGVDEAADLLTLTPIFDPSPVTSWSTSSDVVGYNLTSVYPPRRASIGSTIRISKRLLHAMHTESMEAGRHMATEMWPASVALHHGLKAVFAPHPVYVDRKWPTDYLSAVLNTGADGGVVGGRSSVFGDGRRGVLGGLTWGDVSHDYGFSRRLWKRWLGYRDEQTGEGGEEWEMDGEGRMCLPPMLLGGVHDVNLIVE